MRVRMVASGVCHSCLHSIDGSIAGTPMPIVLGDEGAGVVDEVGPEDRRAEARRPRRAVLGPGCGRAPECMRGRPALCTRKPEFGYLADGTTRFSKGRGDGLPLRPGDVQPVRGRAGDAAIKIRDSVPLSQAALVGCSVSTGAGAVLRTAGVEVRRERRGDRLRRRRPERRPRRPPRRRRSGRRRRPGGDQAGGGEAARRDGDGGDGRRRDGRGDPRRGPRRRRRRDRRRRRRRRHRGRGGGPRPRGKCVIIGAPPTGAMLSIDPHALRAEEKDSDGLVVRLVQPARRFPQARGDVPKRPVQGGRNGQPALRAIYILSERRVAQRR